ncbi:hypothetical protein CCMA1212_009393 [Trichoderma ghanense]|uniref:Uncharacterized protein n=1 Tax=Trichoderma ghanense TaxID=65468 RepID=A0ABY2GV51_9HYPO
MEVESPRFPLETTSFVGCPDHPPWKKTAIDRYVYASHYYNKFDEALNWTELESKIRSVRYHLSECIRYQNCPEIAAFTTPLDQRRKTNSTMPKAGIQNMASAYFQPQTGSIFKYKYYNSPLSRSAWRLKIASDMAYSGLDAMEQILACLHCWRNGRETSDIVYDITKWFLLMYASYTIRTLHYSPVIDTTAHAALLLSSCLALRSTCQLLYIGIRSFVISRCQSIVSSLSFGLLAGDVHQRDVDSLHGFWFRGLSLFRVEERLSIPVGSALGTSGEHVAQGSLPAFGYVGYVIPEDD